MLKEIRPAIVMLLLLSVITGLVYPYVVTGAAHVLFPHQAAGSLIEKDGKVIGSSLIGQNFTGDQYFHGRPSATTDTDPKDPTKTISVPYKADASTGSNYGPTSQALIDRVKGDVATLKGDTDAPVPVDLVTASASGLDPDVTPAGALFQAERVAKARNLSVEQVKDLIAAHVEGRTGGVLGEPHVNVLELNLALDSMK
jgi:potassium-transporting ATPase KdpC subunit